MKHEGYLSRLRPPCSPTSTTKNHLFLSSLFSHLRATPLAGCNFDVEVRYYRFYWALSLARSRIVTASKTSTNNAYLEMYCAQVYELYLMCRHVVVNLFHCLQYSQLMFMFPHCKTHEENWPVSWEESL